MGKRPTSPTARQNRTPRIKRMNQTEKIVSCRVVGDQEVELTFADGFMGRLALGKLLWGPVFEPLKDPVFFRTVKVEDDTIRWPNGADFCPSVLRCWCEAGGVLSQEETDRCFQPRTAGAV